MKGFTDKALILLPKMESWEFRGDNYAHYFKEAVKNVLCFCKKNEMQPVMLTTDEVACKLAIIDVLWDQSSTNGDKFFMAEKCSLNAPYPPNFTHPDLYKKAIMKYPVLEDISDEEYFSFMIKRDKYITREIIKQYKFVIFFNTPNNPSFSVSSKADDERIVLFINNNNFMCKSFLSGNEIPVATLLDMPTANKPVCDWVIPE